MKLLILGYGAKNRPDKNSESTGKDHLANRLHQELGLTFESSSYFAAKTFIFDLLKEEKGYTTLEECFEDRHSKGMRKVWHDAICDFNKQDPTALSSEIFKQHDIYVGLRCANELQSAKNKWDDLICIWIDATKRIEPEDTDSCTVTEDMCDFTITNNGSVEQYDKKIDLLINILRYPTRT